MVFVHMIGGNNGGIALKQAKAHQRIAFQIQDFGFAVPVNAQLFAGCFENDSKPFAGASMAEDGSIKILIKGIIRRCTGKLPGKFDDFFTGYHGKTSGNRQVLKLLYHAERLFAIGKENY